MIFRGWSPGKFTTSQDSVQHKKFMLAVTLTANDKKKSTNIFDSFLYKMAINPLDNSYTPCTNDKQ